MQAPDLHRNVDGHTVIQRLAAAALALIALIALIGLSVATGGPAAASWTAAATGTATARTTTIQPASSLAGTCSLLTGKVTLTWTASPTPWIDGYSVEWGTASHTYTSAATTAALTFTTPALGLGTFFFAVRSTKGLWRSTYSNEISKTFLAVQCF